MSNRGDESESQSDREARTTTTNDAIDEHRRRMGMMQPQQRSRCHHSIDGDDEGGDDVHQGREDDEGGAAWPGMDTEDGAFPSSESLSASTLNFAAQLEEQKKIAIVIGSTVHGIGFEKQISTSERQAYSLWKELNEDAPMTGNAQDLNYEMTKPNRVEEAYSVPESIDYERMVPSAVAKAMNIIHSDLARKIGAAAPSFTPSKEDYDYTASNVEKLVKKIDFLIAEINGSNDAGAESTYPGSRHTHGHFDGLLNDTVYQHDPAIVRSSLSQTPTNDQTTVYYKWASNAPRVVPLHDDISASLRHMVLTSTMMSMIGLKQRALGILERSDAATKYSTSWPKPATAEDYAKYATDNEDGGDDGGDDSQATIID
jgi:hypothetical protein